MNQFLENVKITSNLSEKDLYNIYIVQVTDLLLTDQIKGWCRKLAKENINKIGSPIGSIDLTK